MRVCTPKSKYRHLQSRKLLAELPPDPGSNLLEQRLKVFLRTQPPEILLLEDKYRRVVHLEELGRL